MINNDNFFTCLCSIEYLKKNSALTKIVAFFAKVISIFFVAVFFIFDRLVSFTLFSFVFNLFGSVETALIMLPQEMLLFISVFVLFVKLLVKVALLLLGSKVLLQIHTSFVYFKEKVSEFNGKANLNVVEFSATPVNQKYNS